MKHFSCRAESHGSLSILRGDSDLPAALDWMESSL